MSIINVRKWTSSDHPYINSLNYFSSRCDNLTSVACILAFPCPARARAFEWRRVGRNSSLFSRQTFRFFSQTPHGPDKIGSRILCDNEGESPTSILITRPRIIFSVFRICDTCWRRVRMRSREEPSIWEFRFLFIIPEVFGSGKKRGLRTVQR